MNRREFILKFGKKLYAVSALPLFHDWIRGLNFLVDKVTSQKTIHDDVKTELIAPNTKNQNQSASDTSSPEVITLFLCGDVMTGRGIDQILPYPSKPRIYESFIKTAKGYIELAERKYGPLPRSVAFSYIWGDITDEFGKMTTDVKIINLETAVTQSEDYWPGKGINYRMHPENIACITAAGIDCCALANNHVLDWGYAGLDETLRTLSKANLKTAGAGTTVDEAEQPAILTIPGKCRVLVYSYGSPTSGIPYSWAVSKCKAGLNFLKTLSSVNVQRIAKNIAQTKQQGDIVVISIHWGSNWGYGIPSEQIKFAHQLIDAAGVDIIHGHSSHHPKAVEVYKNKPIIYGCGDFINDYEGIRGHQHYHGELGFMYFVRLDALTGRLIGFELKPTRIKRFRVNRASDWEAAWLYTMMERECKKFATWINLKADNTLVVDWD